MPKIPVSDIVREKGLLTGAAFLALAADPSHAAPDSVTVADLDVDGIFWGLVIKHPEDVVSNDVIVPPECDLRAGGYRLNRQSGSFEAMQVRRIAAKEPPSTDRAFAELLDALEAGGMKFTPAIDAWRVEYRKAHP